MALDWIDLVAGESLISAEPINRLAHAIQADETAIAGKQDALQSYLASADKSLDGNTLTLTDKDGNTLVFSPETGGGGTTVHNNLTGRDAANAHPASAITAYDPIAEDNDTLTSVLEHIYGAATDAQTMATEAYDIAANAIPAMQKGAASGVATLDTNGKVPNAQLPDTTPSAYIKSASVSGNTLTLLDKTDTPTTFRAVKPQTLTTDTTTTTATLAATAGNDYVFTQELTSLALSFGNGTQGDEVNIMFKSGSTATNLTMSGGNYATDISAIDANSIIEISAKYVIDRWVVWAKGTAIL